jgi:hypothetical protein
MYELYTRDGCTQCEKVKSLLKSNYMDYREYLIGKDITAEEVKEQFPRVNILPIILYDGLRVTNYDELRSLVEHQTYIR